MESLRARTCSTKVFLLSGVEDQVRKDLARKINLLGGKYFDIKDFKAICTHVVCGKLSRSEKFLGACATGKWVLHPDYVHDSMKAGCWLNEEQYEWCDELIAKKYPADLDLALAPRRWRFLLGGVTSAFKEWKVAVVGHRKRGKVLQRLLSSAGAEVFSVKLPVRNPQKVANVVTYLFLTESDVNQVACLMGYVMCLKPEFVADYLLKDPTPDPMDYLVRYDPLEAVSQQEELSSSQDTFLNESQWSANSSPAKTCLSGTSVSTTPTMSPRYATPTGPDSVGNQPGTSTSVYYTPDQSPRGKSSEPAGAAAYEAFKQSVLGTKAKRPRSSTRGEGARALPDRKLEPLMSEPSSSVSSTVVETPHYSARSARSRLPVSSLVYDFTEKLKADPGIHGAISKSQNLSQDLSKGSNNKHIGSAGHLPDQKEIHAFECKNNVSAKVGSKNKARGKGKLVNKFETLTKPEVFWQESDNNDLLKLSVFEDDKYRYKTDGTENPNEQEICATLKSQEYKIGGIEKTKEHEVQGTEKPREHKTGGIEKPKELLSTDARNSSKTTKTSTPVKKPFTKKQLLQAKMNLSPITKFFKPVVKVETPGFSVATPTTPLKEDTESSSSQGQLARRAEKEPVTFLSQPVSFKTAADGNPLLPSDHFGLGNSNIAGDLHFTNEKVAETKSVPRKSLITASDTSNVTSTEMRVAESRQILVKIPALKKSSQSNVARLVSLKVPSPFKKPSTATASSKVGQNASGSPSKLSSSVGITSSFVSVETSTSVPVSATANVPSSASENQEILGQQTLTSFTVGKFYNSKSEGIRCNPELKREELADTERKGVQVTPERRLEISTGQTSTEGKSLLITPENRLKISIGQTNTEKKSVHMTPEKRIVIRIGQTNTESGKSEQITPEKMPGISTGHGKRRLNVNQESPSPKKRWTRSSPRASQYENNVSPNQLSTQDECLFTTLSPSPRKVNLDRYRGQRPEIRLDEKKDNREERSKRKLDRDEHLRNVVEYVKRRKLNSGDWCPSVFTPDAREKEDLRESVPMLSAATGMISATLEDRFTIEGLQQIRSHLSLKYYLQPVTLSQLMRIILQGGDEEDDIDREVYTNMAYTILCQMLQLHPPTIGILQEVYLQSLTTGSHGTESNEGSGWSFINHCISEILSSEVDDGKYACLLFKFIIQVLQQNYRHFQESLMSTDPRYKHMLYRIMWSPSFHVAYNTRCRNLLCRMGDVLELYHNAQSEEMKHQLYEVFEGIMWMVAAVTDSCRIMETGSTDPVRCQQGTNVCVFVHEIAKKLSEVRSVDLLCEGISRLQLPWLKVLVCRQLLNALDDYLLVEEPLQSSKPISLLNIVTQYFYLLPQIDTAKKENGPQSPAKIRTKLATRNHNTVAMCLTENTDINKVAINREAKRVNKKNHKGETPLHVACIRNNVVQVKKLLQVPGIDVNAKDNAGWTPLHEACNHGNLECVRELLKFVPSKTVDVFFSKDVTASRKVDLLATNAEGITPLHDAVVNNKLEVCQLLLQHGGPRLLEAQTFQGFSPVDLAETPEMISILLGAKLSKKRNSNSLGMSTGSQDSFYSGEDAAPCQPSDDLYLSVLHADGQRVYANKKSLVRYIKLTTALVSQYLKARSLDLITLCVKNQTLPCMLFAKEVGLEVTDCQECSDVQPAAATMGGNLERHVPHCRQLFSYENTHCRGGFNTSCDEKENGRGSQTCSSLLTSGQGDDLEDLKRDLKVLNRLPQFVQRFRNHLLRISRPSDIPVIERELIHLSSLTECL